jgi:general L-amino acid transport system permease protein
VVVQTLAAMGPRTASSRALAFQALIFIVVVALVGYLAFNLVGNLGARSIHTGFGFLWSAAGFDIGESFLRYDGRATYGAALLVGLLNTLAITCAGILASTVIGTVIGLARLSRNPLVGPLAAAYVEAIRNVPLLLQLYVWYAALTQLLPADGGAPPLLPGLFLTKSGLHFPVLGEPPRLLIPALILGLAVGYAYRRWARRRQMRNGTPDKVWPALLLALTPAILVLAQIAATASFDLPQQRRFGFVGGGTLTPELTALLVGLSLYNAAFVAEILRGAIQSVAKGQGEAAAALGLRRGQVLRLVVVPQAMRVAVPPLASQYLNLAKNSSLAVAIGYPDLMSIGNTIINQTGQAIEVIAIVMAVYLTLSLAISALMNWYNARVRMEPAS